MGNVKKYALNHQITHLIATTALACLVPPKYWASNVALELYLLIINKLLLLLSHAMHDLIDQAKTCYLSLYLRVLVDP